MTPTPDFMRQSMALGAAILAVLLACIITLSATSGVLWWLRSNDTRRIAWLEENLRYWQGVQESRDMETIHLKVKHSVENWKLQGELDACRQGKKP